jgi:hypothetical protein
MKDVLHNDGQKSIERKTEQGCAKRKHHQGAHALAMSYELDSFLHAGQNALLRFGRDEFAMDHEQRSDYGEVGKAIQRETPRGTECGVCDSADRRAQDSCQVELNRIHCDRVGEIVWSYQSRQESGIGRSPERLAQAHDERECKDVPDLDNVSEEQRSQQKGARHLYVLRGKEHLSAVETICEYTTEQGKDHDRKLAQKKVQTEIKGIFGQIVD